MSESTDIQNLIDDAAVANKRSRLQVFDLSPARGERTMFIDAIKRRWALKALFLVVLLAALAVTAGAAFAQGLVEYALVLPSAGTGFQYGAADLIRFGDIEINVETYSSGGSDGFVAATWTDEESVSHAVTVDVIGVEAIRRDMNGDLEELVLNGRGKYVTGGEERVFAATVALDPNAWTATDLSNSLLATDDSLLATFVLPADLQIGPEVRVQRTDHIPIFCDPFGENCQPAPP
jgi:hypothetical protein